MSKEVDKLTWVAPVLEQIAMVDTQDCMGGSADKNHPTPEAGMCGQGTGS